MRNLKKSYNLCLDFSGKKLSDKLHSAPKFLLLLSLLIVELDQIQTQSKIKCFNKSIYIIQISCIVFILMVTIQANAPIKYCWWNLGRTTLMF